MCTGASASRGLPEDTKLHLFPGGRYSSLSQTVSLLSRSEPDVFICACMSRRSIAVRRPPALVCVSRHLVLACQDARQRETGRRLEVWSTPAGWSQVSGVLSGSRFFSRSLRLRRLLLWLSNGSWPSLPAFATAERKPIGSSTPRPTGNARSKLM